MAETKYNKVKEWIRTRIIENTYRPNQKINSESELMKQFGVSRHTVRIAIGELVNEGWLYTEQGAGTFCADRSSRSASHQHEQKKIAIITTYISDYIFPSIIRGAEAELSKEGYHVTLFSTNNSYDKEKKILETIISQKFDGAIIEPTQSASANPNINYYLNLDVLGIPYLMINAFYEELEPVHVVMDDEKGGYLQTKHLLELGHSHIAGFFKTDDRQGVKRMKGFIKAFREKNMVVEPKNIVTYSTTGKDSKPADYFRNVWEASSEKPTAVVCYNDELAIRLLHVIREKKLSIPDHISIVGYDNSFLAEVSEVKLTTIEHPKSELGKMAAQMIVKMVTKGRSWNIKPYVFEPKLILRESTMPPLMTTKG
ncbi:GntR family transcriptional regulator [Bacillus horti]|uniref:GntR family transcriptional regulator of arabinose operon n=1 Tax=Caldalkalibacillus horti TaxID=77523 RepID=A0ABT9W217_9BACI|nr:GntR family transcriptional regulator [Bacillus horti]MDQ0167292.1 GntR family transcriptional regulator of arabinose operon [Bacillus horti]